MLLHTDKLLLLLLTWARLGQAPMSPLMLMHL
jgi:hypothetical protein